MKTTNIIDPDAAAKAVASLKTIASGFAQAAAALEALFAPFAEREPAKEPASLTDKFKDVFEATCPKAKPVQPDLPGVDFKLKALVESSHRATLGDFGFADEANPVRQAVGQAGGLATAGLARAPSPDRRRPGTVNVKFMDVNQKRRYWRWAKDRSKARAAGQTPPTWTVWASLNGPTA